MRAEKHGVAVGKKSLVLDNVRIRTDFGRVDIGRRCIIGSSIARSKIRCKFEFLHSG